MVTKFNCCHGDGGRGSVSGGVRGGRGGQWRSETTPRHGACYAALDSLFPWQQVTAAERGAVLP